MKNKILIIPIIGLLALGACNANNEGSSSEVKKNYSIIFDSDYCVMNNESTYEENENVSFTITLKDEFKDSYTLPEDIYVLKEETKANKGVDYTYNITSSYTATLSTTISSNLYVGMKIADSSNYYKVTEESFATAMALNGIDYIQREYNRQMTNYAISFSYSYTHYLSPNINYFREIDNETTYSSLSGTSFKEQYYEKNNDEYYIYTLDDKTGWEKKAGEASDFASSNSLAPTADPRIAAITFDDIKANFDETILSYKFNFSYSTSNFKFVMRFSNNKLDYLEFIQEGNTTLYINMYFTYFKIIPELPIIEA